MPPAVYDVKILKFQSSPHLQDLWETKIEVLSFPGWQILTKKDEKNQNLNFKK